MGLDRTPMTQASRDPLLSVAAVQMDVRLGDLEHNLGRVLERLREAADAGAGLVVFPECALSGYCFSSLEDALPFALPAPLSRASSMACAETGPLERCAAACHELAVVGVIGFLERDDGGRLFNSALIVSPGRALTRVYRKTHLPTLGVDRFVVRGSSLDVVDIGVAVAGPLICYDIRFPEAARVLTLKGAEVILLPTNWPDGAESAPEYVLRARARENSVYIIAANRVGTENGTTFIGRSQIVAPDGVVLAQAGENETIIMADIEPSIARQKRIVFEAGEWEQDTVGDRRPDLYGELVR